MNPEGLSRPHVSLVTRLAASRPASAGLLLLAVAVVFAQTVSFAFLNWDDNFMVTANDFVRHGLTRHGLAWLPTGIIAYSWHPLTNLSWMVDASLWGAWAGGFHLSNVAYHAAAVLIAWRLLLALGVAPGIALVAGLLFAVHPLRAEPVAWVTGRKDLMIAVCALAAAWAYFRFSESRSWQRYLLVTVCVALAAAAKPLAIVLVPLFIWIDLWQLAIEKQRLPLRQLVGCVSARLPEKLPWLLLTFVPALMMWGTHDSSGAVLTPFSGSLADRVAYPLLATGEYLRLTVWPVGLQFLHPMWSTYSPLVAAASAGILIGVSALAWRLRYAAPAILFGWGWFLVTLAPGSGIVRIGFHSVAERYVNLPHVGLLLALVAFAAWALQRLQLARWQTPAAAAAVIAAMALAIPYVGTWRDSETMYRNAVAVDPSHVQARKELANLFAARGEQAAARAWLEPLRLRAMSSPDPEAAYELASFFARHGPAADAEFWFERAVAWSPQVAAVHMARGQFHLAVQRYPEAVADFEATLRMRPGFKYAWVAYGYALYYSGRNADAETAFQRAIAIDPSYAEPHFHLGVLAERRGDRAAASRFFGEAMQLDPWHAPARRHLDRLQEAARAGGAAPVAGR